MVPLQENFDCRRGAGEEPWFIRFAVAAAADFPIAGGAGGGPAIRSSMPTKKHLANCPETALPDNVGIRARSYRISEKNPETRSVGTADRGRQGT